MKIIFLDIDGPLIPGRTHYDGPPYFLLGYLSVPIWRYDPVTVNMINKLTNKYDAWVVYNSSHNEIERKEKDYLKFQSHCNGLLRLHDDHITDYPDRVNLRRQGIENWLRKYPDTTHWVSVDDYEIHTPNFVKVSFMHGIGLDEYEAMEKFLKDG